MAHVFEKKWRSDDVRVRGNVDFSAVLLSERMLEGLKKAGFKKPSPIQLEAVPVGRLGKDLIVQAKSGTGKTLVFVIVALEMLKRKLFRPQVLVVVPTREIATQICSVIKTVGSTFSKLTCNSFIGGLPLFEDKEKAVMSQIVVGTPGRLKQLIQLKSLPTNSIRLLVLDEADEILHGNSFKDDIDDIFTSLPDEKQVIATSATFNTVTKKLLFRYLRDPQLIRLNAKQLALLGMIHYAAFVEYCPMPILQYKFKLAAVENILKTVEFAQCLLFCSGVQRVEVLYRDLKKLGFSTAYISSAKEQCDRLKAIERLKRFKCKVLVSSDLTSRGIDAENVDLVINFDLSYVAEVYMHRVGRAGRYGSVGVAISIITENEVKHLKRIEKEGSFKTYKLPDPIPKDIILYPVEEDYVIDKSDSENIDCSEGKNFVKSSNVDHDILDKDYDSKKLVGANCIQIKKFSEINVDINACENASPEPATQSTSDMKSFDDITKLTAECEIKVDVVDEDYNDHSIPFNEETADKILQNGYNSSSKIKVVKIKDSDFLTDCDQSEILNSESTGKPCVCDVHENPSDLCDENAFEKQGINNNIEKDSPLFSPISNFNKKKKNNIDVDDIKICELFPDNVSESLQIKYKVETTDFVNGDLELVKSSDTLCKLKAFVDIHDLNQKRVESTELETTFHKDCQLNENSGEKPITVDMINTLKAQKNEFLCKTFKTFLEDKDRHAAAQKTIKEAKNEMLEEAIDRIGKIYGNRSSKKVSNADLANTEINSVHSKLTENSEIVNEVFPEKPNFESTPQLNDKIRQEDSKMTVDEAICKPVITSELCQLFQKFSDESRSTTFHKDCQLNENSGEKAITVDMINTLKAQKNEFLCKTFLEDKDRHAAARKTIKEAKIEILEQTIDRIKKIYGNRSPKKASNADLANTEINSVHAKLTENSEIVNEIFPEKPNFESTPQLHDKIRQEDSKMTVDEAICKPVIPSKLCQLFQKLSDESDSDDSSSNEESAKQNASVHSASNSLSSESELDSLSSDSETDCSFDHSKSETSSDSSSTTLFTNENMHRHKYYRTGRQNPSLIMDSSRNRMHHDHIHANYFQKNVCPCCCTAMHYMPQQRAVRSEIPRGINRGRRPRVINQNASVPFSGEESASYFRRSYQPANPTRNSPCSRRDFQSTSRREQSFADLNVSEFYLPRNHSRCHRSMNSPRHITRKDPTQRRFYRCHHTLSCFLPTEHRCHPNTPAYSCNQAPTCEMWYKTFYNQWLHIQNVIH